MIPAPLARQFARFTGVGAIGTAAHYALLFALTSVAVDPVAASAAGFVLGALVNYLLNRRYTFASDIAHRTGAPRFFAVATAGLLLNTALMTALVSGVGMHYFPAQLAATVCVLIWNFFANRCWTFREVKS